MQGGNITMGQELLQATAMFNPSTQSWEEGEACFASVDGMDKLIARTGGEVINYRSPSYGTFLAQN